MWEINKGSTECDKRTITCDVGTRQCEDRTVKCEKKVRKPPKSHCDKRTVTCDKNRAYMMLVVFNMTIKPLNLRKNEKKRKTNHYMWQKNCQWGTNPNCFFFPFFVDNRQRTKARESKIANISGLHWALNGHPWTVWKDWVGWIHHLWLKVLKLSRM